MKYKSGVKRLVSVMLVAAVFSCYCFTGVCENKSLLDLPQQANSKKLGKKLDKKEELKTCLILAEIGVGLTAGAILFVSLFYTATKHKRK